MLLFSIVVDLIGKCVIKLLSFAVLTSGELPCFFILFIAHLTWLCLLLFFYVNVRLLPDYF